MGKEKEGREKRKMSLGPWETNKIVLTVGSGFTCCEFKPSISPVSPLTPPLPGSGRQPCNPRKAVEVPSDAESLSFGKSWVQIPVPILTLAV